MKIGYDRHRYSPIFISDLTCLIRNIAEQYELSINFALAILGCSVSPFDRVNLRFLTIFFIKQIYLSALFVEIYHKLL